MNHYLLPERRYEIVRTVNGETTPAACDLLERCYCSKAQAGHCGRETEVPVATPIFLPSVGAPGPGERRLGKGTEHSVNDEIDVRAGDSAGAMRRMPKSVSIEEACKTSTKEVRISNVFEVHTSVSFSAL